MKIVPMRDLRDTIKISELCHTTNEPVFVTKNGYGDLVVLSMECYEELFSRKQIYDEIMRGKEKADQGELMDGDEAMSALKAKYGEGLQL